MKGSWVPSARLRLRSIGRFVIVSSGRGSHSPCCLRSDEASLRAVARTKSRYRAQGVHLPDRVHPDHLKYVPGCVSDWGSDAREELRELPLTEPERQVISLMAKGLKRRDIATSLSI